MSDFESAIFQCPTCGRDHPWRPESAGRPIHCACGASLTVPFTPGVSDAAERTISPRQTSGELPLKSDVVAPPDTGSCPECNAPMREGALVCTQCGFRRRRSKPRLLRRRGQEETPPPPPPSPPPDGETERVPARPPLSAMQAMGLSTFRDLIVPGILAVAGLVMEVILLRHAFPGGYGWVDALACTPLLVLLAVGAVAVVFLSDLILLPVFDVGLGPLEPLVPKLAAAVLFPAAAGALIQVCLENNATGIAVGWLTSAVLYLLLFRLLFDFEWADAMVLIACVCLAHAAVLFLVIWPLTQGVFPLPGLWKVFGAVIFQSLATFTLSGALIIPHFRRG